MKVHVLLLEDDSDFATEVKEFLSDLSYEVLVAGSLQEAKIRLSGFQPEILLLDMKLPDGTGLEFFQFIKEKGIDAAVVFFSGYAELETAIAAMKAGAEEFLTKPLDPELLQLVLQRIVDRRQLKRRQRIQALDRESGMDAFLGVSARMQAVLDSCRAASQSDATVLLVGETGTGKQLLAQYIHNQSPRKNGPFVYVNCAALSETLLESDLFGHEKGAFTGAAQRKPGRAELASGGTLFLDEVAEIPVPVQAKLLHFLEYGFFHRVGGTKELQADVRLICATNQDLTKMVAEKSFREDLYFRLHVVQIEIPPLRDRVEDIEPFLHFFLDRFAREMKKRRPEIPESLLKKLQAYPWPGNVRELKNAVERALIFSQKAWLTEEDFPFLCSSPLAANEDPLFTPGPLKEATNRFKKLFINKVLEKTHGNQTKAAEILGIQRTYLNRLLNE